jgi:hypothetical protein
VTGWTLWLTAAAAAEGVVTGTVSAPEAPPAILAHLTVDRHVCGQEGPVYERRTTIDPQGRVAQALVWLEGGPPDPPPKRRRAAPPRVLIDQQNCAFVPRISAARAGAELWFRNSDPVLHNVHAVGPAGESIANFAMPIRGQEVSAGVLSRPGEIHLRCDAGHRWMSAVIRVFEHGRFSQTDSQGRFRIGGVPPGTYRLVAWHPDLGRRETEIVLAGPGEVAADLRF